MKHFWTPDLIQRAAQLYMLMTAAKVATELGLTTAQVRRKMQKLGIRKRPSPRWENDEDTFVFATLPRSPKNVAKDLHRTESSVKSRRRKVTGISGLND